MLACLALIEPFDIESGRRVSIRVSSVNDAVNGRKVNGLGDQAWQPALVQPPVLGMALWNGDFQAAVSPASAALPIAMGPVKIAHPRADRWTWIGAPVTIYAQEAGTPWPWPVTFKGRVSGYGRKAHTLTLTAEVDSEPFRANILTRTYAGTGGAEGGADLASKVKPLALGWPLNVDPALIDADNSVYQFSAYGAIEAVTKLYERGSDFGAATADYASYALLVAATIAPGKWATCLAEGLIRLGAPAYGVITGDIKGHKVGSTTPRLTGAIVQAMATIAGVDAALIDDATLDALDADIPYPANLVLTDQATWLETAQDMALGCNYQSGVAMNGAFFVTAVSLDTPDAIEIDARGRRSPQVTDSEELDVSVPYWRTVLGANRAWRVHTADEIAFAARLLERGLYASAITYREGNIVDIADGSRWIYINAAAGAGIAPPTWPTTSNAYWSNLTPPLTAANLTYVDGTTIEARKPAEIGADVTLSAQVVVSTPQAITINADQYGTVIVTGQLPKVLTPTVTKGGVDKRTDNLTTYAILNAAGGCVSNVTVNNTGGSADKGRQTIGTGIAAAGYYDLEVTYNSVVQPLIRVTVKKENALPPSGGGGSGGATKSGTFDPAGFSVSSTSYVEMARISGLVKASGETIRAYLDITYDLSASVTVTSTTVTGQWQYSVAGANSWTAFSSPASSYTGSGSTWNNTFQSGTPGALTCNQTVAPADGTYDIRLVLLESSAASSRVQSVTDGTASVVIAV